MDAADGRFAVEIGQGAGDLQHAVVTAGGEFHLFGGVAQQLQAAGIGLGQFLDHRGGAAGIGADALCACALEALLLDLAGAGDAARNIGAGFSGHRPDEVGGGDGRDVDADIDAVHQRAGDAGLVIAHAARAASAAMARLAGHAAAAGVHRRNQLEFCRIGDAVIGTRNDAFAAFERLAQRIERLRREFGKFVEKEHAVMGKRGFARTGAYSTTDEGCHGGGMMRGAEGPAIGKFAAGELAGDRMDHRHLEQLGGRKRRQDRRQPGRQHRLAGARRTDHQKVMAAGRGHLERPFGAFLALDLGKVRQVRGIGPDRCLRPGEYLRAAEMIGKGDQAAGGENVDLGARPGGFGAAFGRADQPLAERIGADRSRQRAGYGGDRAVEIEFADDDKIRQGIGGNGAEGGHQGKGDRQIEMRAFLRQVGRRQIDRHALGRQRQAGGVKGRLHALAAFGHRLVGQTDDLDCEVD